MKIDTYNSQKISILSFVSIVMVVYIHNYYLEAESLTIPKGLQMFGSSITSVAVPLFYAISGFLFFSGMHSVRDCFPKIRKRCKNILLPYLIWNIIFVLWYVVLKFTHGVSQYVNSDMLSGLSITHPLDTFNFLFIKPAGFHLWFLRDLMLFVVFSPFLYVCITRLRWIFFGVLVMATGWMTRFWISSFVFGGTLALCCDNTLDFFRWKNQRLACSAILFWLICSIIAGFGWSRLPMDSLGNYVAQIKSIIFIIAVWGGYDLLVKDEFVVPKVLNSVLGYSFFIYLFHEPALNIIKKLGLSVLGLGEWQLIVLYLVNPFIMCVFAILVAKLLQKLMPKVYSVLVGGR